MSLLLAFADEARLAQALAMAMGWPLTLIEEHTFPDGETRLRLPPALPSRAVLLRGLLFAPDGDRMIPTFTRKGGRLYRYYMPSAHKKSGAHPHPIGTLPAGAIEAVVIEQVLAALRAPEMMQAVWDLVRRQAAGIDEPAVVLAMRNLGLLWHELFPAEQCRTVKLLIERVTLRGEGVDIEWHPMGWSTLAGELSPGTIGAELRAMEAA